LGWVKTTTPTPYPPELPFLATKENISKIKALIMDHYASSCFNQCKTQPLPLMSSSPPLRLNIDPKAKPVACHRPPQPLQVASIPANTFRTVHKREAARPTQTVRSKT
jgi:hypothetical protein